jgi:hypothetical protein
VTKTTTAATRQRTAVTVATAAAVISLANKRGHVG